MAINQILVMGGPTMTATVSKVGVTNTASNQQTKDTVVTAILVVSRVVMATNRRTKIIIPVTHRLHGVVMVYRKVVNTTIIRRVVTRVVTAAMICETAAITNSNRIINLAATKVISKIGISRHVFASKMITGVRVATVILRSGIRSISKTDLVTVMTIISKTGIRHLANQGNAVLLNG